MVELPVDLKLDVYELIVEELYFVKKVIINKKFMFCDELLRNYKWSKTRNVTFVELSGC